jgi:hypothetical protein
LPRRDSSGGYSSLRILAATTVVAIATSLAAGQTPATNSAKPDNAKPDDGQIVKDFETRVSHYLEERKQRAGTSPRPTTSAEKLEQAQQSVAQKAKLVRDEAKQGDIFAPDIADYFRRQIAIALKGPQGVRIRSSLRHSEPVPGLALRVNQSYPRSLPLQSTPPSLLLNFPPLPKELQYRIVGRALVLLDITPKLIVDFIPDAIPSPKD